MDIHLLVIFLLEILAIVIGLFYWKTFSFAFKLILLQVILAFTTEVFGFILSNLAYQNVWLYNCYAIIEVWLLGMACNISMNNSPVKKTIQVSLLLLTLFWIISTFLNGLFVFNNWMVVAMALFYIVFFIIALFDNSIFNKRKIFKEPIFLVASAIIIYYSTIIPLFGLINYLVKNDSGVAFRLFLINHVAGVLRYALIAIAFYLYGKQAKRGYVRQ